MRAALTEEGHYSCLEGMQFLSRHPPAQLPDLDMIVNFCIAKVGCLLGLL